MFILEISKSCSKVKLNTMSCENHQHKYDDDFIHCPYCGSKLKKMDILIPRDIEDDSDITRIVGYNASYLNDLEQEDQLKFTLDEFGENLRIEIYVDTKDEAMKMMKPIMEDVASWDLLQYTKLYKTTVVEQSLENF